MIGAFLKTFLRVNILAFLIVLLIIALVANFITRDHTADLAIMFMAGPVIGAIFGIIATTNYVPARVQVGDMGWKKTNRMAGFILLVPALGMLAFIGSLIFSLIDIAAPPTPERSSADISRQVICEECAAKCGHLLSKGFIEASELEWCGKQCARVNGYSYASIRDKCGGL